MNIWGKDYLLSKEKYMQIVLDKSSFLNNFVFSRFKNYYTEIQTLNKHQKDLRASLMKERIDLFLVKFSDLASKKVGHAKKKKKQEYKALRKKFFEEFKQASRLKRQLGVSPPPVPMFKKS